MEWDRLRLSLTFGRGVGELKVGPDHPLTRCFMHNILKGKSPGSSSYLFVEDVPKLPPIVVGTFVHTPGDRVLFCPGADFKITTSDPTSALNEKTLDHVTLEGPNNQGKYSSHFAVLALDKSPGSRYKSAPIAGYMLSWFSLITPNLDGFWRMPQRLIIEFPPPRPDVRRFAKDFGGLGHSNICPLPPDPKVESSYFKFDISVARGDQWRELTSQVFGWGPVPENVITQYIELSHNLGIRIHITRPLGHLESRHILRPRLVSVAKPKLQNKLV